MKNLNQLMQQAQKLQEQMAEAQSKLAETEASGQSGAGLVKITLNGKGEMRGVQIDKSLLNPDEGEILEDLIVAAFHDAKQKIDTHTAEEMGKVTGGLSLPGGLKLPF